MTQDLLHSWVRLIIGVRLELLRLQSIRPCTNMLSIHSIVDKLAEASGSRDCIYVVFRKTGKTMTATL